MARSMIPSIALCAIATALAPLSTGVAAAEGTSFDLSGPVLHVTVSRGDVALPLSQVPALAAGDRLAIQVPPPLDRRSRFSVVLAFLRGATSPPPPEWLLEARPWDPKRASIDAAVPTGAEQAMILLVPDTGGAMKAVEAALRGRPGAFVRAVQELTRASLDRARLDAYLAAARAQIGAGSAGTADTTAALSHSLAVKVDAACLARQADVQAACLAEGGGAAVLADAQTTSLAQNLAGAPADVALALSSTPQASFGYYSPYIGLVRDLARIFGAFQSAQLQFIPTLEVQHGQETQLFLNTPPSFRRPQSVLVAPLPAVAPAQPPILTPSGDGTLCITRVPLLAGFTGTPLLYATGYARDMKLRVATPSGSVDLPVSADPVRGGYVVDTGDGGTKLSGATHGTLHGLWGFEPFEGARYTMVSATGSDWRVADRASLVVGRESPLPLEGGAAACLSAASLERDGDRRTIGWSTSGERGVTLKVPLDGIDPGPVSVLLNSYGVAEPQRLTVRAYSEPSHLSSFATYLGERAGVLTGSRLDQVSALDFDGVTWRPDALGRVRSTDRLDMIAPPDAPIPAHAGDGRQAKVTLVDGRTAVVKVVVGPARPAATLVSRSVERLGSASRVPIAITDRDAFPAGARVTFSLRAPEGLRFAASDQVEIAAGDQGASARLPLRLQDAKVALADFVPAQSLGAAGFGPARFRLVKDGIPGDWRPLGTIVRLPTVDAVRCTGAEQRCMLEGRSLYLIRAITPAGTSAAPTTVQDGLTANTIPIQRSPLRRWRIQLRDAPGVEASLGLTD